MLSRWIGPAEVRDLEPWHADEFAELFRRPDHDLYEWLPWEEFEEVGPAREYLQRYADGRAADERRIYGLWLDGTLVGATMFSDINLRRGAASLAVFLAKPARGQGIVTRTVEAMIEWAFDVRHLHRLEWRCVPANAQSRAIPQRLGFTHEGTLRQTFRMGERYLDSEVWALLRDDRA